LHDRWRITELAEIRLLVYTTSVGLQPSDPLSFDYASLSAAIVVCDPIYNPPESPILRAARATG
jgi:shikimate dehydrogenase